MQLGAIAVNLVAGEKPADVYSGIATRYAVWTTLCFALHLVYGRTRCPIGTCGSQYAVPYWPIYSVQSYVHPVSHCLRTPNYHGCVQSLKFL